MSFLAPALVVITILCGVLSSASDIKTGLIPNKIILICGIFCLVLRILADTSVPTEYILHDILNAALLCSISFILYLTHIWGGGDCKLFIIITIGIPYRYYWGLNYEYFSLLYLVIIVFSIGFVYLILESIILFIEDQAKQTCKQFIIGQNFVAYIKSYISFSAIITLLNQFVYILFPEIYAYNTVLIMFIDIVLIWIIADMKWSNTWYTVLIAVTIDVLIIVIKGIKFNIHSMCIYLIIIAITILRNIMHKYDYQEILPYNLKPGMILAQSTIFQFAASKINELPKYTTEDLKTKISAEECLAIKEWATSMPDDTKIMIVRKIPFAIFILLGYLFYIMAAMLL